MPPKDVAAIAHDLLDQAGKNGLDDATWEAIFAQLRATPDALARPRPRNLSLLQQAACWGNAGAVTTLLEEFGADPKELTDDWWHQTAAEVAEYWGHHDVGKLLHAHRAKVEVQVAAKLAHELLTRARAEGRKDDVWNDILTRLRENPAAIVRPEVRNASLLHQAAYFGKKAVVETLVNEFGADPKALTVRGLRDAAAIAEQRGHADLATWLRGLPEGPPKEAAAANVASPYDPTKKVEEHKAGQEGCVAVWLCLREDGEACCWEPYLAEQNVQIEAARSRGESSAKLGPKSLHFKGSYEVGEDAKHRNIISFKVLWEWDSSKGGKAAPEWQYYQPEAQWHLEAAMCAKYAFCDIEVCAKKYFVDLVGLRQYSAEDAFRCRRVRRRGVPLREPFPAEVRDRSGRWLTLTEQPPYWAVGPDGLGEETFKRFDLPDGSDIVAAISQWMNKTIRGGHCAQYGQVPGSGRPTRGMEVVRVEVVQQPALWRRYCCYKGQLTAQSGAIKAHAGSAYLAKNPMAIPKCAWLDEDVGEAYFWHGSGKSPDGSFDLIDAILSVGHGPSDDNSGVLEVLDGPSTRFAKTSSMFGAGVYLADISSKANLYVPCPNCHQGAYFRDPCNCSVEEVAKAGLYRMLLCRAVMGRVYVEQEYKEDRYKGEFNPAKKLGVDSVMGEAQGKLVFREYVVYNDSASYPEFVVHYRRRSCAVNS